MRYTVYPVHTLLRGDPLRGAAVVIDTLRMTTVAATALENGCADIRTAASTEEALKIAGPLRALLGGERQALKIPGFDLSNSPLEYTRERVAGRRLVLTTTNGTQAIASAVDAPRLYLGCLRNAGALARLLRGEEEISFVLAGTAGRFSLEDAVTAGALLDRLPPGDLEDMGAAALALYRQNRASLADLLAPCPHYRRLQSLGFGEDLDFCLREDCCAATPLRLHGEAAFHAPEKQTVKKEKPE